MPIKNGSLTKRKLVCISFLLFSIATIAPTVVGASFEKSQVPLQKMVRKADLIFTGEVVDVHTKLVKVDGGSTNPFTFVTYKIFRILKGAVEASTITLRFFGGPLSETRYLLKEEMPLFDTGETDTLFVKHNDISDCPLINCAMGRFRLIEGMYYSDSGRSLKVIDEDLYLGATNQLAQVTHHTMSPTIKLILKNDSYQQLHDVNSRSEATLSDRYFLDYLKAEISHIRIKFGNDVLKITRSSNLDSHPGSSRSVPTYTN